MSSRKVVRLLSVLLLGTGLVLCGGPAATAQTLAEQEAETWELMKDSPDPFFFENYPRLFPNGPHTELAKKLAKEKRAAKEKAAEAAAIAAHSNVVEIRARHIMVKTETEAKAIIEQLSAGADFAELAQTRSLDTATAEQGGDLHWFDRTEMVEDFSVAAFALKPGEFSKVPVQTQWGYHIIKVEDAHYLPQ